MNMGWQPITLYIQHKCLNHDHGMAALIVYKNGLCMRVISNERGNNTLSVNLLLLIIVFVIRWVYLFVYLVALRCRLTILASACLLKFKMEFHILCEVTLLNWFTFYIHCEMTVTLKWWSEEWSCSLLIDVNSHMLEIYVFRDMTMC